MIAINSVSIIRGANLVIANFSDQIPAGSITVIVGPNGSGKSTLLAAIAGDLPFLAGAITIAKVDVGLADASALAKLRAMSTQNQSFTLGFTVREVIEMAGPADDVLAQLDLTGLADRHVTTLSGGQAQRVAIAQAIAQKAAVLLLDEPLANQDMDSRRRIIELLQVMAKQGKTIVVVAHANETQLTWADKIIEQRL